VIAFEAPPGPVWGGEAKKSPALTLLLEEGLMVARGNPLGIRTVADLAQPMVRLVNRDQGAALRVLLDDELQRAGSLERTGTFIDGCSRGHNIINQKDKDVVCVYCWVGGANASLLKIIHILEETGAMDYTIVVAASASASSGEQYLAPYVAAAAGEYFMHSGRHALVVFDDLTKHAWIYRELSLLLERSPGREAYPGDIFYLHSQLMERAGRLNTEMGSGSMTFLPIVETLQGDITGYVQSNLVSMTDGQIYISSNLFHEGFKPAIDLGLSVSRIGSKVQSEALREVTDTLRLDYAQYKELMRLMRVRTKLSTEISEKMRRGETLTRLLIQDAHKPESDVTMIVQFYAFKRKILEILSSEGLNVFCEEIMDYLAKSRPQVLKNLALQKALTVDIKEALDAAFVEFFREKKII